jgi:antitoxin YefM
MITVNSTDVRKDFGAFIDNVTRKKPIVVKRSRDVFMGISLTMMEELLKDVKFEYTMFQEKDGSCTLSLDALSIAVNAKTYEQAFDLLVNDVKEYCSEYYEDLDFWHSAPNRKAHFPYVIKTLVSKSDEELKKDFICLADQI